MHELLLLPPPAAACHPQAAFVSVLSDEAYVRGAICLRRSMRLARSRCPFLLLIDDLPRAKPLSPSALASLTEAYGSGFILYLSELHQRTLNFTQSPGVESQRLGAQAGSATQSEGALEQGTGRALRSIRQSTARASGGFISSRNASLIAVSSDAQRRVRSSTSILSRLPRSEFWGSKTHQKVLVWAIPHWRRAVFLDLDLLVMRNIDAITFEAPHQQGDAIFSAVAALPYSTKFFNSGVFLFEPSLTTAAKLYDLSIRATFSDRTRYRKIAAQSTSSEDKVSLVSTIRVQPAAEKYHLTDQSIMNHYFRGKWRKLPYGYNVGIKTRSVNRGLWNKIDIAVIHFVGSPKPWELHKFDNETSEHVRRAGQMTSHMRWRGQCDDMSPNGTNSILIQ